VYLSPSLFRCEASTLLASLGTNCSLSSTSNNQSKPRKKRLITSATNDSRWGQFWRYSSRFVWDEE
jgi:hypothetical protein